MGDGAIVLDQRGLVMYAAVKLNFQQERWLFKKHDGGAVGTRHASALAAAVWLSNQMWPGVVYVRSDGGGLHCIFGGGRGSSPELYYLAPSDNNSKEEDINVLYSTLTRNFTMNNDIGHSS